MNATKTLICILTAGAALGAAAPVFADPEHDRGRDHDRGHYSYFDRHDHRNYNRDYEREYNRRHVIVVQRPYVVEQPVYYPEPAASLGIGAVIGAAIGGYIDSRQ
jgi:hypothetical protein